MSYYQKLTYQHVISVVRIVKIKRYSVQFKTKNKTMSKSTFRISLIFLYEFDHKYKIYQFNMIVFYKVPNLTRKNRL